MCDSQCYDRIITSPHSSLCRDFHYLILSVDTERIKSAIREIRATIWGYIYNTTGRV